jgi:hypothetical protein
MNFYNWDRSYGIEMQLPINRLNANPIPDIFLPFKSRISWRHYAVNVAIYASVEMFYGVICSCWRY